MGFSSPWLRVGRGRFDKLDDRRDNNDLLTCPGNNKKRRKYSDLDWPQITERLLMHTPHPGNSKKRRKYPDLDWPQAAERLLMHTPHPGTSKIRRKYSDLAMGHDECGGRDDENPKITF